MKKTKRWEVGNQTEGKPLSRGKSRTRSWLIKEGPSKRSAKDNTAKSVNIAKIKIKKD
jgi:hypothetical protein